MDAGQTGGCPLPGHERLENHEEGGEFPQALKNSISRHQGNEMIINIKDSSVLNVIGVVELMYAASSVAGIYYKYLPNYVSAALIYLVMTCCISALLNTLSRRLSLNAYRGIPSSN